MKKILITGGSGFLGSRLAYYYRDKYDLLLPTHSELNVSREEAVRTFMEEHRPDIVIHCAALSNTWYCEQHIEESHRVNVQGTVRIAKACKLIGAKLIFMSSDQVYNGTPELEPLTEWDVLQPVNIYGKHKLEAEQRAQRNFPDSVGLRLTWMYDLPGCSMKQNSNILVNLHKAYSEGTTIKAAIHEYRGVTYVWNVVKNMEKTFDLPGGIYNFGSRNMVSRRQTESNQVRLNCQGAKEEDRMVNSYDLHIKAANIMGLKEPSSWILPDGERFSDQKRNLTMDCSTIEGYGIYFPDSIEGIDNAVRRPFRTE